MLNIFPTNPPSFQKPSSLLRWMGCPKNLIHAAHLPIDKLSSHQTIFSNTNDHDAFSYTKKKHSRARTTKEFNKNIFPSIEATLIWDKSFTQNSFFTIPKSKLSLNLPTGKEATKHAWLKQKVSSRNLESPYKKGMTSDGHGSANFPATEPHPCNTSLRFCLGVWKGMEMRVSKINFLKKICRIFNIFWKKRFVYNDKIVFIF